MNFLLGILPIFFLYGDSLYSYWFVKTLSILLITTYLGLPRYFNGKESAWQCRRCRFHPWIGKIPWRRAWQPIQYSCRESPMDRGVQQAIVHTVGHDWVIEHALYFGMMGVAWAYTYANIHREITLRSVHFTLVIIQSNILSIENRQ